MSPLMLDILIFGGGAVFCAILYFLLTGSDSKKKIDSRIKKVKSKTIEETIEEKALNLRRHKDTSLEGYGLNNIGERLTIRIQNAGLKISARNYLIICTVITFIVLFIVSFLLLKPIILGLLLGFIAGFGIPHIYCGIHIGHQQRKFLKLFPDAIELIVRGLRAGLPVNESMKTVAQEIPEPVAPVFAEICDQIKLGIPVEKAMADMAAHLKLTEFNFFVIGVTLQRETGGNLGEILSNLAEVLRQRHMLKLKIKAMSSEARASAMIVGALPFLVTLALLFVSPDYLTPMIDDIRGNIATGIALAMLASGMFIMSRMAKFKI